MTDEVGCKMRAPLVKYDRPITSEFLERVARMPLIYHRITVSAQWYQNMKKARLSGLQTIIESMETVTVLILAWWIPLVLALPLPFAFVDSMACTALDLFELFLHRKNRFMCRFKKWTSGEPSLTSEEAFMDLLIEFERDMRNIAVGEKKSTVQAFLDTQIGLFDRIDGAIESLYQNWSIGDSPVDVDSDSELQEKRSRLFRQVHQTFEEVMEQRNSLTWIDGRPSPLEPVWEYSSNLMQELRSAQATMPQFSRRIYFMRVILRTIVEEIKQVSITPKTSFMAAQIESLEAMIRSVLTWFRYFAIERLEEIKTLVGTIGLTLTWLPSLVIEGFGRIREHEAVNPVRRVLEQDEGIELTPPGSDRSSDTVVDSDGTIVDAVHGKIPCDPQQVSGDGVPAGGESNGRLGTVDETSTEADDSSDQNSNSGQEHSSELESSNEENRVKPSRAARRRRKNSFR